MIGRQTADCADTRAKGHMTADMGVCEQNSPLNIDRGESTSCPCFFRVLRAECQAATDGNPAQDQCRSSAPGNACACLTTVFNKVEGLDRDAARDRRIFQIHRTVDDGSLDFDVRAHGEKRSPQRCHGIVFARGFPVTAFARDRVDLTVDDSQFASDSHIVQVQGAAEVAPKGFVCLGWLVISRGRRRLLCGCLGLGWLCLNSAGQAQITANDGTRDAQGETARAAEHGRLICGIPLLRHTVNDAAAPFFVVSEVNIAIDGGLACTDAPPRVKIPKPKVLLDLSVI